MELGLATSAFDAGDRMPAKYAMRAVTGGENISVPLSWSGVPGATRSLALTIVDHAPVAHDWVHWMVVDIPPDTRSLAEGASGPGMPPGTVELPNSFGFSGYGGPEPPAGTGLHPYVVTLYALDVPTLRLGRDATLTRFERAISGHVLASQDLTGYFGR